MEAGILAIDVSAIDDTTDIGKQTYNCILENNITIIMILHIIVVISIFL